MDRRRFLAAVGGLTGVGLAGCSQSGPDGTVTTLEPTAEPTTTSGDSRFGQWFANTATFEGVVDRTGQAEVAVAVGAGDEGLLFAPAAVRVDAGTAVTWEWTGDGGQHNVADQGDLFESEITDAAGFTFTYTFEDPGTVLYFCVPHRSVGMRGAVVVE
jgi:halocyanin-like protein